MTKTTIDSTPSALIRLKAAVQQYPWGNTGAASLAARLAPNAIGPDFHLHDDQSYAEIWMGTHPNGPAHLFSSPSTPLQSLIATDPRALLGPRAHDRWPGTTHVPFLFKILSIEKALPLQAHPDKALGERLRNDQPDLAPDANHKPEIAVAIGAPLQGEDGAGGVAFTGFVGFRPLEDIRASLESVPELRAAVGDEGAVRAFVARPGQEGLKAVYAALLKSGVGGQAKQHVEALARRVRAGDGSGLSAEQARLVKKVEPQYPGDVGVLATTFFMNFVKLRRGEAVYIGADEVHAYLEGDIIECMAVSDNVLNAAFAPPDEAQQHLPTFLSMLTYTARPAAHWALPAQAYPRAAHKRTSVYAPPLEEFVVLGTALHPGPGGVGGDGRKERLEAAEGPTVGIVTRGRVRVSAGGEEMEMGEGGVVFVVPGNAVDVELLQPDQGGEGEVWWATCLV